MATSVVATLTVAIEPTILAEQQGFRVLDKTNITLAVSGAGASYPILHDALAGLAAAEARLGRAAEASATRLRLVELVAAHRGTAHPDHARATSY